ncbi:hypothetical protein F3I52_02540 [Pantoea sp. M_8]|uniref:LIM zinc-binding domain-containing protein n=1 Tax=Pantoea anthophila TaxID=470931 RepID=A0ABY2Z6A3_9GAMM|nr:hypothetical protein F3I51_08855 [Pantoea sp. M_6]KAA5980789.1 hypothetical protein F3I52_02540 [Pantoea sp. M_8]KAA5994471.1 hypothetical protein F3I47_05615 [Pantoea sp. M_10]KAA5995971.1 hypothetical protein F3I50_14725 [Pantoea sp. M_5]PZL89686.1 hypothetical protein CKF42_02025 [Pantoea sp. ARC270]TPE18712.1 hypothetical protein FJP62_01255 [Pantoea vagans]TPV24738.1 hypothetical protein FJW00_14625 [Pantoea anthophila]
MVMKIRCSQCGSARFVFADYKEGQRTFHGACCACCRKQLGSRDLLPNTPMDPITQCLLASQKTFRAPD